MVSLRARRSPISSVNFTGSLALHPHRGRRPQDHLLHGRRLLAHRAEQLHGSDDAEVFFIVARPPATGRRPWPHAPRYRRRRYESPCRSTGSEMFGNERIPRPIRRSRSLLGDFSSTGDDVRCEDSSEPVNEVSAEESTGTGHEVIPARQHHDRSDYTALQLRAPVPSLLDRQVSARSEREGGLEGEMQLAFERAEPATDGDGLGRSR